MEQSGNAVGVAQLKQHGGNHGWQQVSDRRKQKNGKDAKHGHTGNGTGMAVNGASPSVFSALEESSEARRNFLRAKLAAEDAETERSGDEEADEFEGEGEEKTNVTATEVEKKDRVKRLKKPKFTVADAAGAMQPSSLSAFLKEM